MSYLIDDVARTLAEPSSRRATLARVAKLIAGVVVSRSVVLAACGGKACGTCIPSGTNGSGCGSSSGSNCCCIGGSCTNGVACAKGATGDTCCTAGDCTSGSCVSGFCACAGGTTACGSACCDNATQFCNGSNVCVAKLADGTNCTNIIQCSSSSTCLLCGGSQKCRPSAQVCCNSTGPVCCASSACCNSTSHTCSASGCSAVPC